MPAEQSVEQRIAAVRRFSRVYTRRIGVLEEGLLKSSYSLTEARVLYEIATGDGPTAAELCRELGLDAGYLSRILRGFEERGLITRTASPGDARRAHLGVTEAGRAVFEELDSRSSAEIGALLGSLGPQDQSRLVGAMDEIERLLTGEKEPPAPWQLRTHRPGDLGLVVSRHAALYAQDYGWSGEFEALVAEIAAAFIRNFDPARERSWIAEREGHFLGSVLVVKESDETAKLRLLLVEPEARGMGLGRALVQACTDFARQVGYRRIRLWTESILHPARKLYRQAGYRLIASEAHHSFGKDLMAETWELEL